jgi:hypothetical protein
MSVDLFMLGWLLCGFMLSWHPWLALTCLGLLMWSTS